MSWVCCVGKSAWSSFPGTSFYLLFQKDTIMTDDGHEEPVAVVPAPPPAELPEIKLFGRWSCDDVQISDMSLQVTKGSF